MESNLELTLKSFTDTIVYTQYIDGNLLAVLR